MGVWRTGRRESIVVLGLIVAVHLAGCAQVAPPDGGQPPPPPAPGGYLAVAGGPGQDRASAIAATPDGGAVVGGDFVLTATFGDLPPVSSAGARDVFVAELDLEGEWRWIATMSSPQDAGLTGVAARADGGTFAVGRYAGTATFGDAGTLTSAGGSDVFVAALDEAGAWAWAESAGGANGDQATGVAATMDGGAIVAGTFFGSATFGLVSLSSTAASHGFVAKIGAGGTWLWATGITGSGGFAATPMAVSSHHDGGAFVAGSFSGTVQFGTSAVPPITLESAGGADVFVARIDASGNWLWAVRAGGVPWSTAYGVAALEDGGALVSGTVNGPASFGDLPPLAADVDQDAFVARLTPEGSWAWLATVTGTDSGGAFAVRHVDAGAVVVGTVAGTTATFGDLPSVAVRSSGDAFVAGLSSDGAWLWAHTVGGAGSDDANDVAILVDGRIAVAGRYHGPAEFGDRTVQSVVGSADAFVLVLTEQGDP